MGWGAKFVEDLSSGFHDYGVLWTPKELIFEIDGEPVAAVVNKSAVHGPAEIAFPATLFMPACQNIPRVTTWS